MPEANLIKEELEVNSGLESKVIVNALGDIPGGRTLDVTGFSASVINAGHIIIADATGVCKPMPVDGDAYDSLPANHTYVGVLKASIATSDPRAAIVTIGQINAAASPYPVTSGIKSGLPLIQFIY